MRSVLRQFAFLTNGGRFWLAAMLVLVFAGPVAAASFTASLDRDSITLGESATLTLTFEGGQPSSISEPDVPGLEFNDRGSSQNITFINGQMSAKISQTFEVDATKPGDYTIPPFKVQIGGQTFTSQPLKLKVLKPGAPSPQAIASGTQIAFLKLGVPKTNIYVGETIVVQMELYLRDVVRNAGQFQFTSTPTDGFTGSKWIQGQPRQVRVGNAIYRVVPLSLALTAVKAGSFDLGPITASLVVILPSRNGMSDPFGFFNSGEQRQITLATDSQKVHLLPLPVDDQPANFNGAVGNYTMNLTAGPTNVAVGDPITVRLQISGRGALDLLSLPGQEAFKDFKTYPPTSKVEPGDKLGIQGTKTFEEIVSPESADIKELPPFSFSFFDPDQEKYETLTHPAIPLTVRPSAEATAPVVASASAATETNTPPPEDILYIKQHFGTVAQIQPMLIEQPWFLAVQGVPVLALVSVIVIRKRNEKLANNPRLRRQRKVAQIVRVGLAELRDSAAANDSEAFFATVFRLLQEQLGERLDVPASAITEAVVEEQLRPRSLPESTLAGVQDLFQVCNLARYAPIRTSQELAAIVPKVESVLGELCDWKG